MDVRQSTRPAYNGVAKYATTSVAASIQPAAACFAVPPPPIRPDNQLLIYMKNLDKVKYGADACAVAVELMARRHGSYLAEKLEPSGRSGGRSPYSESYYAGWIWCSGTSVKAVDFIHYDEKNNEWNLLQVKNRDNTENSSSSKIRDNTTIKKWFRTCGMGRILLKNSS